MSYEIQIDTDQEVRHAGPDADHGGHDHHAGRAGGRQTLLARARGECRGRDRAVERGVERHHRHDRTGSAGAEQPEGSAPGRATRRRPWSGRAPRPPSSTMCRWRKTSTFTHIEVDVTVSGATATRSRRRRRSTTACTTGRCRRSTRSATWGGWSTPFQFALTNMTSPKDGTTTTSDAAHLRLGGGGRARSSITSSWPITPTSSAAGRDLQRAEPQLRAAHCRWRRACTTGTCSVDAGDWMPTWTLVITPAKPGQTGAVQPGQQDAHRRQHADFRLAGGDERQHLPDSDRQQRRLQQSGAGRHGRRRAAVLRGGRTAGRQILLARARHQQRRCAGRVEREVVFHAGYSSRRRCRSCSHRSTRRPAPTGC